MLLFRFLPGEEDTPCTATLETRLESEIGSLTPPALTPSTTAEIIPTRGVHRRYGNLYYVYRFMVEDDGRLALGSKFHCYRDLQVRERPSVQDPRLLHLDFLRLRSVHELSCIFVLGQSATRGGTMADGAPINEFIVVGGLSGSCGFPLLPGKQRSVFRYPMICANERIVQVHRLLSSFPGSRSGFHRFLTIKTLFLVESSPGLREHEKSIEKLAWKDRPQ
ncbi:uncharacterized protein BT62DRAFT_1081458 [Guyanagaster necrorhizus]|uniref:Uncharacterized protein n=1 Tax=Guyanagaster necrorhizus TaxID=856835 RepID=A0A9P7VEQ6_9AGAR|nr:uncharacterized protein BT62DRAFT_1081458 [Guyanagaster necrorhizus MCA 3950]KAG7439573.1 hypothetical protein BT62DRAFT_1081458 [Guyanagaster necrorhizus MCA 3950]